RPGALLLGQPFPNPGQATLDQRPTPALEPEENLAPGAQPVVVTRPFELSLVHRIALAERRGELHRGSVQSPGKVQRWVAHAGIAPVDHAGELSALPENVRRPEIPVDQGRFE